jgi:hypothetical protein
MAVFSFSFLFCPLFFFGATAGARRTKLAHALDRVAVELRID